MDPTKIYKAAAKNDTAFLEQITSNEMKSYLQDSKNILKPITDNEDSILHVATKFRRMRSAKELISLDQSLIYLGNKKGDTPLHVAASIGCWDITKLLIDRRSDILEAVNIDILETVNIDKDTTLHVAVRNAQHLVVELLIGLKPGLAKMVNEVGESALFLAVDRNNYHTAKYILDSVPESIRYGGRDRMNVLHGAIIRMVTNQKQEDLNTALIRRVDPSQVPPKDYDIADFLSEVIQKEPNLASEADDFGWTPLHYAAHYGSVQVVELLLQYAGSSAAYIKDKEGMSALHIAAERGHLDVVEKVVSEFPSTYELLDNERRTPLHVAAESGKSLGTFKFLLYKVPADLINKPDSRGNTLLHLINKQDSKIALAADHTRFNELVREIRFDKGAINNEGLSCLDILKSSAMTSLFVKNCIPMFEANGFLPSLQAAFPRRTIKVQTTGTSEPQIESRNTSSKQEENDAAIPRRTIEVQSRNTSKQEENEAAFPRRTIKVQTTGTSEPQIESRNTSEQEENDSSINGKTEQGADSSFVKEKTNVNILVATFVATVTFAAIFTMPYREDGATSGQKLAFRAFAIANSVSFVLSTASMFLHFISFGMKEEIPEAFSGFLTYSWLPIPWSVHALVVAYSTGSYGVLAHYYPKIASWAFGLGLVFFIGPLFAIIRAVRYAVVKVRSS